MIRVAKAGRSAAGAVILSCLLSITSQAADDPGKISTAVDRAFRPLMKEHQVPGMAVAVTIDGKQYFFNYGVASKESGAPVSKDTLFEIGSISKTFTATLATYAQTLGRLSLNDHLGQYMPQLRGSPIDKATLLNLGTYTAGGLPLQFPDGIGNNAGMANYFRQWKPDAAAGEQRRYSNPSIGLFGYIAALAMKGSFADLIETELFPKLGLTQSYIRVPKQKMGDYAWGYNAAGKPVRARPGVLDAEAYGVRSTSADMIRFVEANIQPEKLEPQVRQAIEGTHVGYFRVGEMVQGLGWELYAYPITLDRLLAGDGTSRKTSAAKQLTPPQAPSKATWLNKTGSTNGFGAYVAFVPEKKIGVVMLANRNIPVPARITAAHAVLEQLSLNAP